MSMTCEERDNLKALALAIVFYERKLAAALEQLRATQELADYAIEEARHA